ncbi:TorF family putative porin [Methylopila sp. M107]|uniref:TorF family putative porin n=1 Tax=Methylopila sp. M107 TaxID=1101190 RepID=UPI00037A31D0|nr:TorF family putative porin [Methylopila sp. M107]
MLIKSFRYLLCLATLVGAAALSTPSARAADIAIAEPETVVAPVGPAFLDVAFGVAGVTDYRFRGVSNSRKDPAVQGYVELQAFEWVYVGVWASSVKYPAPWERSGAAAEVDLYGGLRHAWGALSVDVGGLYYSYPGKDTLVPAPSRRDIDYWEIYAKPTVSIGDAATVGGNLFWTSDFMNLGSDALYLSVIPKLNLPITSFPNLGFYVSGEFGKQWFGKTTKFAVKYNWNDYVTWNAGGGVAYKAMTLDLRYSDTDLSKRECAFNYNVKGLCGPAFVAKLSFDTTLSSLK